MTDEILETTPIDAEEAPAVPEVIESMDDYKDEIDRSFCKFREGDIIKGIVISVNETEAWFDIGTYIQAVMPREEASADPKFSLMRDIMQGDELQLVVVTEDDGTGRIVVSKKRADSIFAWDKLYEYFENQTTLSVKISGITNGGAITYVEGIRAFIPVSQLSLSYVENIEDYLNKAMDVKIITVDSDKQKLVLSARVILEEQANAEKNKKMKAMAPGAILAGTVDKIMPYGAFIKLDNGLTGLCHISQVSDKRIRDVKEVLKLNDNVIAKVLKIENGKISLSIKEAMESGSEPEEVEEEFEYKEEGTASTGLAALLAGIKLN